LSRPPASTLFPYTTLFRSEPAHVVGGRAEGAVQRNLEATAEGVTVEQREARDLELAEHAQRRVAELGDLARLGPRAQARDDLEVRASAEAALHAGHDDRDDLSPRGPLARLGEALAQLGEPRTAERRGARTVRAVVEHEQQGGACASG